MADQADIYKEEGVWHCDRKITKLYYHCDLENCHLYNDKQKWGLQELNNHRKNIHKLPPIPERPRGRQRKDPSQQPKCIYKKSDYQKLSLDKEKTLKHIANSKRRRALFTLLSKHGVKLLTDLSDDIQKEVQDKLDEIMKAYETNENRQKRWIEHLEHLHRKGEPVEDMLAKAKEKGNHFDAETPNMEIEEEMLEVETKKEETKKEEMLEMDLEKVETEEPTFEMEMKKLHHSANIELDLVAMEDDTQLQHSASTELDVLAIEDDTQVNNAIIGCNEDDILAIHERSNITIKKDDIKCLLPKHWLNDTMGNEKCGGYDYNLLKKWTKGIELQTFHSVIVPINIKYHWSLAIINFSEKKIQYFDSLNNNGDEVCKNLVTFLIDEAINKCWDLNIVNSFKTENVKDIPLQHNLDDCGVFMLLYADFYCRGLRPNFQQEDIPDYRKRIKDDIMKLRVEGDSFRNDGGQESPRPSLHRTGLTPTIIRRLKDPKKRNTLKAKWVAKQHSIAQTRQKRQQKISGSS